MKRYWLVKSEPGAFSIMDLAAAPDQRTSWDGVRNYQARNFMRDDMRIGDEVLFYHSRTSPGVVGVARVVREAYPDHTAFDENDPHYDPGSDPATPRWYMVDIRLVRMFDHAVSLKTLRGIPELQAMTLLKKGNRLSVMPVREEEFSLIVDLATQTGQPT
ncbi:MAG TPA: EVE domain-containing protein [Desulfomicrobiaceae bacterium]|nr:EVE domain-containing protein [Desulfomicrobiaceae bacterium]